MTGAVSAGSVFTVYSWRDRHRRGAAGGFQISNADLKRTGRRGGGRHLSTATRDTGLRAGRAHNGGGGVEQGGGERRIKDRGRKKECEGVVGKRRSVGLWLVIVFRFSVLAREAQFSASLSFSSSLPSSLLLSLSLFLSLCRYRLSRTLSGLRSCPVSRARGKVFYITLGLARERGHGSLLISALTS